MPYYHYSILLSLLDLRTAMHAVIQC